MTKEKALVICPGRGSYQSGELGYFNKYHADKTDFIKSLDDLRAKKGQTLISALDQEKRFTLARHTNGENASLLIYACAIADFMTINQDRYEIVAVAGNSMGWYLSLACAGALNLNHGAELVNTMGTLMHNQGIGGQLIYPLVDDKWKHDPNKVAIIDDLILKAWALGYEVFVSIRLGGLCVLAGDQKGLAFLKEQLPAIDRYPMTLSHHSAFHSPLQDHIIPEAQNALPISMFHQPSIPMIDGNGFIWSPGASDIQSLYQYTLGTQINATYDFTRSVGVGLKEFCPDKVIVLGPGTTMGPPVAQTLIDLAWLSLKDKASFKKQQKKDPFVLSMGLDEQRELVTMPQKKSAS